MASSSRQEADEPAAMKKRRLETKKTSLRGSFSARGTREIVIGKESRGRSTTIDVRADETSDD